MFPAGPPGESFCPLPGSLAVKKLKLGLALLTLAFVGPKTAWGFIGIVPLVTGLIGSCPAYSLLGLRTCSRESC